MLAELLPGHVGAEVTLDGAARRRVSPFLVDASEERLEGAGQDRRLASAVAALLAFAEAQQGTCLSSSAFSAKTVELTSAARMRERSPSVLSGLWLINRSLTARSST